MSKIKVCGLKRLEDIEAVNACKPDCVGFVFANTKRFVSDDIASTDDLEAIAAAREDLQKGETVSHNAINWD